MQSDEMPEVLQVLELFPGSVSSMSKTVCDLLRHKGLEELMQ